MLHFMLFIPILFAILVPLIYKIVNPRIHTGWFVLIVPVVLFSYLLQFVPNLKNGEVIERTMQWIPSLNINHTLHIDGLSFIFGLLITGIGSLVVLYSIFYMSQYREAIHNFYIYLLLFMWAMLGLVFSDNILILYVFWELTSVSSFLLIAFWYHREGSRNGAKKSMLITVFGGLSMLAGLLSLSIITGTYSIREMIGQVDLIVDSHLFTAALVLILLGAFTKSAQFPFYIWLPDAMEAPTPVSAYLHSATMVKAGIYLVARFTAIFGGSAEWFWLVTLVGLVTLIWGSFFAIKQTDLKALLAYSTVSQLGLIMCLLGLGSVSLYFGYSDEGMLYAVAITAAIFHLVNHSMFKGTLFMVIGIVDHEMGTRDIRKIGGLMHFMPISFTFAVIGGFAMAGLPPFNGFLSKEMFFTSVLNITELSIFGMNSAGMIIPIIAWIASIFTFIYCMIVVFSTFSGKYIPKLDEVNAKEAPLGMLIAPGILATLVVFFFFFPNILSKNILEPAVAAILPTFAAVQPFEINIRLWHGLNMEVMMTIAIVVIGIFLYRSVQKWNGVYDLFPQSWTINTLYEGGLYRLEKGANKVTNAYMTGFLRDYFTYIFLFFIIVIGGALWLLNGFTFDPSSDSSVELFEVALVIMAIISAVAMIFLKSRLSAIISVGVLGYIVAIFFVIFQAPDLALTQLVVETVTVALFLLCYYHLPELRKEHTKKSFSLMRVIISVGVGATTILLILSAQGNRLFESISSYFEDADQLAGAKNIVNAILVDFRGVDTMLEILVLCMAGLGVYVLIRLRLARRED